MFVAPDQPLPIATDPAAGDINGTQQHKPQHFKRKLSNNVASSMAHHGLFPRKHHHREEDERVVHAKNIHHNMALFDRSELVLGDLLGNGAFCQVHELRKVEFDASKVRPYLSRTWWDNKLHQTGRTREYIRQTCLEEEQHQQGDQDTSDMTEENYNESQKASSRGRSRYVVKHLRPNLQEQRSYKVFLHAAADLRMEYEILSRLSHPNIVQLKGGAIIEKRGGKEGSLTAKELENQNYFLLLERLEETLSQRIHCWKRARSCPTSMKQYSGKNDNALPYCYLEKLRYAQDIASALAYIHEQRLIFRDLKPDNVALTADGRVKLIDFGLCRELPKASKDYNPRGKDPVFRMSGVGTRRYMAPEMIMSQGYNQKIDCYSWAMVFYEMLSLQKPFASYNREMHKILVCENEDRPRPTSEVPAVARKLLDRAWAQDSSDRLSMAEILTELGTMIDNAERQAMPMHERSLKVVMEMAELFAVEDAFPSSGSLLIKRDDSLISRKSTAELTVSTSTSASSEASFLSSLR